MRRNELESEALQQLIALAESPLPVGYVSAMPGTRMPKATYIQRLQCSFHADVTGLKQSVPADAHLGKGVSIGTVFASERYVAPMAVGVDIGALSEDANNPDSAHAAGIIALCRFDLQIMLLIHTHPSAPYEAHNWHEVG